MTRKAVLVSLACSMMVLVGLLPIAAGGDHIVAKGAKGPFMSAETWSYTPVENGTYSWRVENFELKWMNILIYDNTSGSPTEIFTERIRFPALNAYPIGIIYTAPVVLTKDGLYEVTAVPNGKRGTYAIVTDPVGPNAAPIASFSVIVDDTVVHVDASASYDVDGVIDSYLWDWGDGTAESGVTAIHTYAAAGTYTITLTAVDNIGCPTECSQQVTVTVPPP